MLHSGTGEAMQGWIRIESVLDEFERTNTAPSQLSILNVGKWNVGVKKTEGGVLYPQSIISHFLILKWARVNLHVIHKTYVKKKNDV